MLLLLQAKLEASHMFLMANKAVPGSSERVLYLTAAVATAPAPTQMLLEVRARPLRRHCQATHLLLHALPQIQSLSPRGHGLSPDSAPPYPRLAMQ